MSFVHAEIDFISSQSCKIESLSTSDIKKLFLLKKKKINKQKVTVLDTTNKELYRQFLSKYLHKSVRQMKTYWVRMLFTGKKIPPKKVSLRALTGLADNKTCHIAYILNSADKPKNWKKISIK